MNGLIKTKFFLPDVNGLAWMESAGCHQHECVSGFQMVSSSHARARPSAAAALPVQRQIEATMTGPETPAPSGWWLLPAAFAGLGLIIASCLLVGFLTTFAGLVVLTAGSALCAAIIARNSAPPG